MPDFGGAAAPPTVAAADFERFAAKVRNPGLAGKLAGGLVGALFEDPRAIAAFFRRFRPIAHVPFFRPNPPHRGFWLITRYDDVMEVLSRDRDFPVPFETAFRELDPTHENFLLGMADDDSYRAIHAETMKAFRLEDIPAIGAFSAARAEQLVEAGGGELDAIGGLLTQVPTEIIGRYYGIPTQDPNFWSPAPPRRPLRSPRQPTWGRWWTPPSPAPSRRSIPRTAATRAPSWAGSSRPSDPIPSSPTT